MTPWAVQRLGDQAPQLDAYTRDQILTLATAAEHADGVGALDDQVRIDLEHPSDSAAHFVVRADDDSRGGAVIGYAHLDRRAEATGHMVVAPDQRRQGIGRALAEQLIRLADGHLAVWAHGDVEGASALAAKLQWRRGRELRQLRLARETPIADPSYPEAVAVRTFEPGSDERAWVEVNAAAFATHPEQGRMTVADLEQREEQPWFAPEGFFLAERDGVLLGSHWTKIHNLDDGGRIGEVYVVVISPRAQGLGLGKALTLTGLHHLRDQGLDVMLYADADNTAAVSMYESIGFTTSRVDVMYEHH